jgi:hypothetical protein
MSAAASSRSPPAVRGIDAAHGLGSLLLCRRFGVATRRGSRGIGPIAGPSKALLGALLGQAVACADLTPRGPGLAGGFHLGGLEILGRFSQPPRGLESAHLSVGNVESGGRGQDPPGARELG